MYGWEMPPEEFWSPGRLLSVVIAIGYGIVGLFMGGVLGVLAAVALCAVPLACIWFPEAMGGYAGHLTMWGITRESPEKAVWLGGWALLLFQAVLGIILAFS